MTSVNVFGHIVGPSAQKTINVEHNKVFAGSSQFNFAKLFPSSTSLPDIYGRTIQPLVTDFAEGYNETFLVLTPSNAPSDDLIVNSNPNSKTASLSTFLVEQLFKLLGREISEVFAYDTRQQKAELNLQVLEFSNGIIRDLLDNSSRPFLGESIEKGVHVKGCRLSNVKTSKNALEEIREAWKQRTRSSVAAGSLATTPDVGVVVIQFDLARVKPQPNPESATSEESKGRQTRSRFRLIYAPGAELLLPNAASAGSSALPTLLRCFGDLSGNHPANVALDLMSTPLTAVMDDEFGGNCAMSVLTCIPSTVSSQVVEVLLDGSTKLAGVKNFPINNTDNAWNLLSLWRAKGHRVGGGQLSAVAAMEQQQTVTTSDSTGDVMNGVKRVLIENAELKEKNEFLYDRLEKLQQTYGYLANTKSDLSTQLLLLEEEKLRTSRILVEMQMENNKLEEKMEEIRFELMNKILVLENQLVEAQANSDKFAADAAHFRKLAEELEVDKRQLTDEYVNVKENYVKLSKEVQKMVHNNEQLCIELWNLANSKAALMREYFLSQGEIDGGAGRIAADLKRIKDIIQSLSGSKVKAENLSTAHDDRVQLESILMSGHQKYKTEIEHLRREWNDEQLKWEDRLGQLRKEVIDCRKALRAKQHEVSVVNAQLITMRSERDNCSAQNNRLQHKLKDLNQEYQQRLLQYINDISAYVDKGAGLPLADRERTAAELRRYVKNMLDDLQKCHAKREDQLCRAVQEFKSKAQFMVGRHEALLIAYRNLRQQVQDRAVLDSIDLGPDETTLVISDAELSSQHARENARLADELSRTKAQLEQLKIQSKIVDVGGPGPGGSLNASFDASAKGSGEMVGYQSWPNLQRQLREFTLNKQRELEEERAALLSRCAILEEQLREAQEYIDNHLVKYKDEILRLRRILGYPLEERDAGLGVGGPPVRLDDAGKSAYSKSSFAL